MALVLMVLMLSCAVLILQWNRPNQITSQQNKVSIVELAQYYANYSRTALYEMKKWSDRYNQYLNDFGPTAAITINALDQYNQAKLWEGDNLWFIDGEINDLVFVGTITHDESIWMKERVRELRIP